MGVTVGSLGGMQPICSECGIALCYEIDPDTYKEHQAFWDNWVCEACDPLYVQHYQHKLREQKRAISREL